MERNRIEQKKMSDATIKLLGVLSFLPLILFLGWLAYYLGILGDFVVNKDLDEHMAIAGRTAQNYTSLFVTLAIISTMSFGVMIYQIWHLWAKTDLPRGQKAMWIIFMAVFWIFAHPVYWMMHIKNPTQRRHSASPALT